MLKQANNKQGISPIVAGAIGWVLLLTIPLSHAESTQLYSNNEYRFSFMYPGSWHLQAPITPHSIAKIVSPSSAMSAECAIIVKKVPQLDGQTQDNLDKMLLQSPPDKEQYKATLLQGFSDVSVIAVRQGRLGSRIAHMVRAKYSVSNESSKEFVSVRMAKAFSPGMSWGLTCGGQGKSADEAEKAYEYWQADINNIFQTFRFQ